jgi:hypothetical protein
LFSRWSKEPDRIEELLARFFRRDPEVKEIPLCLLNDGLVLFQTRPMIGPRLASSIPALRKSTKLAHRAVP